MAGMTTQHLSPAPRAVPFLLSIRVVLGGIVSQMGWGFMAFGMIFVWVFDAGGAITSTFRFARELATAEGVSTGWSQTSLTINDVPVYQTHFTFRSAEEQEVLGTSFQTGGYTDQGQTVTVEYVPSRPDVSRIQGMRASAGGLGVAFVYLFPIIGLAFALAGVRKGLRARRLLSTGQLALGSLKSKEATNTRINNQTVYKFTFTFEADGGGTFEVVGKSHKPAMLEDEEFERIVYDPRSPGEATLLDELPCRPTIDSHGNFEAGGPGQLLLAGMNLILPSAALLMDTAYLLSR